MKEKLLLAAAALLGFATACNNEEDQPKVVSMYGVPYNNYKIKGKVTDKAGRPIKGIEVRSNAYLPTPEATTAADGTYDLSGKGSATRQESPSPTPTARPTAATSPQRPSTSNSPRPNARPKETATGIKGHSPNRASTSPSRRRSSPCSRPARLPGRKNAPRQCPNKFGIAPGVHYIYRT